MPALWMHPWRAPVRSHLGTLPAMLQHCCLLRQRLAGTPALFFSPQAHCRLEGICPAKIALPCQCKHMFKAFRFRNACLPGTGQYLQPPLCRDRPAGHRRVASAKNPVIRVSSAHQPAMVPRIGPAKPSSRSQPHSTPKDKKAARNAACTQQWMAVLSAWTPPHRYIASSSKAELQTCLPATPSSPLPQALSITTCPNAVSS